MEGCDVLDSVMDYQHRIVSRTGGGGVASFSETNKDRRERLRKLALETIDLNKIDYPEIGDNITPKHRFMSSYEQRIEQPEKMWQYLLFAAEPYETVAFKIPSDEIDKSEGKFWTYWNVNSKQFFLQLHFHSDNLTAKANAAKGIATNVEV